MLLAGEHQPALQSGQDRYIAVSWHQKPHCRLEETSGWPTWHATELEAQPSVDTEVLFEASRTFTLITEAEGRMALYPRWEGRSFSAWHLLVLSAAACRLCGTVLYCLLSNWIKLTLITFRELINSISESYSPVTAKVALAVGS